MAHAKWQMIKRQMADGECEMTNGDMRELEGLTDQPTKTDTSPKKVTNEAKLETTQVQDIQEFVSENRERARRERSQITSLQRVLDAMANDRVETIVPVGTNRAEAVMITVRA